MNSGLQWTLWPPYVMYLGYSIAQRTCFNNPCWLRRNFDMKLVAVQSVPSQLCVHTYTSVALKENASEVATTIVTTIFLVPLICSSTQLVNCPLESIQPKLLERRPNIFCARLNYSKKAKSYLHRIKGSKLLCISKRPNISWCDGASPAHILTFNLCC
jgi:hypothetical protein